MNIEPGAKLGPYEIRSLLGEGGMGVVWKARDTRLNRDVAVKVLPASFASDADRLRRFTLEAQTAGALNHPNILAIHDVGTHEGMPYMVAELLEGETLRERLSGGKLAGAKAVDYAVQIASGLAAAHAKAVTHRDIKPENIFITRDGRAKILDFGLAKQASAGPAADGATRTAMGLTDPGFVMGTVGYMSPEQVRGLPADSRSDIFSFGVVFYEMLTGLRAFARETSPEVMTAILKDSPPDVLEDGNASSIAIMERCLEKDPQARFQSAADLAFALKSGSTVSQRATAIPPPPRRRAKTPLWIAVASVAGIFAGAWLADTPAIDSAQYRYTPIVTAGFPNAPVVASDNMSLLYDSGGALMMQMLDAAQGTALTPSRLVSGADRVAVTPDRTRVYFASMINGRRDIYAAGIAGGTPEILLNGVPGSLNLGGIALTPDGKELLVAKSDKGVTSIWRSSPPGAPLAPLAFSPTHTRRTSRARIRFSPDGRKLLVMYTAGGAGESIETWVMPWPPKDGAGRRVFKDAPPSAAGSDAAWMPDSRHVVLALPEFGFRGGRLWLGDTGSQSLRPLTPSTASFGSPFVTADGRILANQIRIDQDLVQIPLDGSPLTKLFVSSRQETYPVWSSSGDQFAYVTDRRGQPEVWLRHKSGSSDRPLVTSGQLSNARIVSLAFAPDGQRVAFAAQSRIWIAPLTGGVITPLTADSLTVGGLDWSPDAQWIAYSVQNNESRQLFKKRVGHPDSPVRLADSKGEIRPTWSPDGKWITWVLDEGIGLVSSDGAARRPLLNRKAGPGVAVGWSRDARQVYLLDVVGEKGVLSAIDVQTGKETALREFETAGGVFTLGTNFGTTATGSNGLSLSPDGKAVAISQRNETQEIWMIEGVEIPQPFWRRWLRLR